MSEHVFKLPDLGEGTVESEIGEWFVKVGDFVEEETVVGTMMTDKAAVELSSPISGTVVKSRGRARRHRRRPAHRWLFLTPMAMSPRQRPTRSPMTLLRPHWKRRTPCRPPPRNSRHA